VRSLALSAGLGSAIATLAHDPLVGPLVAGLSLVALGAAPEAKALLVQWFRTRREHLELLAARDRAERERLEPPMVMDRAARGAPQAAGPPPPGLL
jgi:hypothetical protein